MKVVEIDKATKPLSDYARRINGNVLVVVEDGNPVAALLPFPGSDLESVRLATNPKIQEILERSRESAQTQVCISHEDLWATYADERAALAHVLPKAEEYATALDILEESMAPKHRKLLAAHYRAPQRTITAADLARAVGYKSDGSAMSQYGKLAKRIGEVLSYRPSQEHDVAVLATWKGNQTPGADVKLKLRPRVAKALEKMGWV